MKTGPQRYPGASLAAWYQDTFGGDAMEVNVVVLHTTEGRALPDYGGGGSAPNLTAVPDLAAKKLRWFQHFDIETSSRALVNKPGGVATNTLNVCQVELVGTCDPVTHREWGTKPHIFWPEAPDWALAELVVFLRWMNAQHGVPLAGPKAWPAYPSSYGATDSRFTFAEWNAFAGVCGHMHVPENDHGDPGALDFNRLLALAKGTTEEDDVPLTDAEISKIAKASAKENWAYLLDSPTAAEGTNPARTAGTFLRYGDAKYAATTAQIGALQGAVTALAAVVGNAGGITAEQVQAAAEAGANAALDRLGDALTEGN
ncbi:hypothetical protein [Streptomyces graminilatus]|uniref:hypothetical protein n=1 Tax=Streptomyces graminilatus TaxID=1464070 RepID=UPI000AA13EF6|nr:hypothetical protein [Streptomyces graminilatus]